MSDPQLESAMKAMKIAHISVVAEGIKEFEFVDPEGASLSEFSAGAHIAIKVPNGSIRKYSLCNDPNERNHYVIAVKRESNGRGGSVSLSDDAKVGDILLVSDPINAFPFVKAPGYLFFAGGIGITPMLSMIRSLEAEGIENWKLYYLSRDPSTTAYRDTLSDEKYRNRVIIHHDYGDISRSLDLWPILEKPSSNHIFCCGPRPLMNAVRDMSGHWPMENVHFESFADGSSLQKPDDKPFKVLLAKSNLTVEVPAGVTLLDALREAGHAVPASCESGSCGSCRTTLLRGEADHRDFVLTPAEQDSYIMVCVSRAKCEELVIDL
ncbi:MAG: oxidoreductase [Rhodocyclaceae bacterium]|nr:MAG: oxidoreductase [Rhodocyclaceae bacterium]